MKLLKLISITLPLLYLPFMAFNQDHLSQEKLDIRNDKSLNFNFFTGTNYLFSNGYGSAGSIYFGTNVLYPVAPRFTLEFGTAVNFSRMIGIPAGLFPENKLSEPTLHATSVVLYARGNYFLSSRLTLSGTAFKQFSPDKYPAVNPYFINQSQEGMSFEFNYRLFQNLHIGAQFSFIKNNGPFYPSRVNQPVIDNYYW